MEEYIVDKNGLKKKKPTRKFTRTTVYKILYRKKSGRVIVVDEVFTERKEATKKKKELEKQLKGQGYYNFLVYSPQVINGRNV